MERTDLAYNVAFTENGRIWQYPRWREESQVLNDQSLSPISLYEHEKAVCIYGDQVNYIWNYGGISESVCTVSKQGITTLRLRDSVSIDLSVDNSLRIVNQQNGIVLAMSFTGCTTAILHPNGRVFQHGARVEMAVYESAGNCHLVCGRNQPNFCCYAKIGHKGISFTNDRCPVVYLLDAGGTRTTNDRFLDLTRDFSLNVFFGIGFPYGEIIATDNEKARRAINNLRRSSFWTSSDGSENWLINEATITQRPDGVVCVTRNNGNYCLRISPSTGSVFVTSPFLHCTGSLGIKRHLFVRRGDRRIHFDGSNFIVRNAGFSSGFDKKHQIKVF